MRPSKIIYDPNLSIKELAIRNNCTEDGIRYYIKVNKIDRRLEGKIIAVNKIKKYLKSNPTATKEDAAKATKLSICTIRKYWDIAKGDETIELGEDSEKRVFLDGVSKENVIRSIGDNQNKILKDIIRLYIPKGMYDCDLTYSQGLFYRAITPPKHKFDKFPLSDDVRPLTEAYAAADESYNSIVLDLPFIIKANEKDAATSKVVDRFQCFYSVNEMIDTNKEMLRLAFRLLKRNGILVQKVQNTNHAGKQIWVSYTCQQYAQELGFEMVDEFVLEGRSRLLYYQDGVQKHARKYHSYFLVFKKGKPKKGTAKPKQDERKRDDLKDEDYEVTILDGVKFKLYKPYNYRLQDIVQFHSEAYEENQMMSNHYNCIVRFRGVEFYGFEMMFHSMKFSEHPEPLKEVMAAPSARWAKKISMKYRNLYFDGAFKERWYRVYVLSQLFKYLSVKEYRDRLRELRGQTLVECPNGHGTSAEATQDLKTNIFSGRNYSGRFTMLIRDMMLPLEDAAIEKKEAELGRKLTDDEQDKVIFEVCEQVRDKYENLPQVKADTDAVIDYIKDPKNGISLKRKKLKPYIKPNIDWLSKGIVMDFDGCLFDTSIDDEIRKRKRKRGEEKMDMETDVFPLIPQYKLYDGWADLLNWAKNNKIKIGVLCNASRTLVVKTLEHFNLPYDCVVGFDPYVNYPNPIRGNRVLNSLNIREKQVIYIGTNKNAEEQARSNQIKFVGGKWGDNDVMDLNVPLIDNPKEAIDIVKALSI